MNYPPRLETARLYTRALTLADADDWAQFLGDAAATRFLPNPEGYTPTVRARLWIERQLDRYAHHTYGMTALMHRDTGAFIGQCGLLEQTVDEVTELEVGYHIFPQYWRQGYAAEAAQAFRDMAFEHDLRPTVISLIHPDNVGSQGVARRNGMVLDKMGTYRDMRVRIYRISRAEWLQLKGH